MPATATRPARRTLASRIPASVFHGFLVALALLGLLAGGIAAVHFGTSPDLAPTPTQP
ncbi:hypothetical protein EDF46_3477 [Frondihabitans sp. PhB188]|nr:hypothetical protein EDF46_3477 [Frondihabitans sp. PhB188]